MSIKKYRHLPTVPKDSRQRYLPCGQAIYACGARYVTASRDMFALANEGKYHFASSEARYIAAAKAVISRFALVQNISPLLEFEVQIPGLQMNAIKIPAEIRIIVPCLSRFY